MLRPGPHLRDCDGAADELPLAEGEGLYFPDLDDDGYGDPTGTGRCDAAAGFAEGGGDCDDTDPTINPDQEEICNDGRDNNCDGGPAPCTWPAEVEMTRYGAIYGDEVLDSVGLTISTGDWNEDGQREIYTGAPFVRSPAGLEAAGRIDVWTNIPTTAKSRSSSGISWWGSEYDTKLGYEIVLCDIDGDSHQDLITAEITKDSGSNDLAGMVLIANGPGTLSSASFLSLADTSVTGDHNIELLGNNLKCVADMDGDNLPDLIMGEQGYVHPETGTYGYATIVSSSRLEPGNTSYSDTYSAYIETVTNNRNGFGFEVAALDHDGDGLADLFVGAPAEDGWVYGYQSPVLGSLTDLDASAELANEEGGGATGASVLNIGDANDDGLEDLLVSAPQVMGGTVYLLWSNGTWGTRLLADAPIKIRADITSNFGFSTSNVGDLNGDGADDLAIADFSYVGNVHLFNGPFDTAGVWSRADADTTMFGDGRSDLYYGAVVNLGDWNGDGADELAVGSSEHKVTAGAEGIVYFIPGFGP